MKYSVICLFLTCSLVATTGWALHPSGVPPQGGWTPGPGMTVGGSAAYVHGGPFSHAFASGLEVSLFQKLQSPFSFWVTGGGKVIAADRAVAMPYVELGINMFLFNLGVGYGVGLPGTIGRHHLNGFVGTAVPLYFRDRNRLFFLELYYRPMLSFPLADYGVSHELGLMFKWLFKFRSR